MERSVLYCCLIILLFVRTHARVTFMDVSQNIGNELVDSIRQSKPKVLYFNSSSDINDITKAIIAEINLNLTTTRKNCLHNNKDVKDNEVDSNDFDPCEPEKKIDNGTALILTPFLEDGRIEEGRKASEVDPNTFLGFQSYSGFFTVNKTYDSNIFFWYFPVENKPVNETPWIIWLQGGPGASSMSGLFDEIGPFRVDIRGKLERNPYTWLQNHSLVFIENPVGTGYSFTNSEDGYAKDMATYSQHLHSTLQQLLQLFPELRTAPLFVAGESYAGKYVPAFAMEIHSHKQSPGGDLNFKGLIIGNAYIEPGMLTTVPTTFYNFGLLSSEQVEIVRPLNEAFQREISENRSEKAREKWHVLVSALLLLSHQKQAYNFLRDDLPLGRYEMFLRRPEVKRALHVGDIAHSFVNITVNAELAPDFLSSTRPMFETLLNHYRVLAYCGQLDQMLACPVSSEFYRKWRWDSYEQFQNSTRFPFIYRNRVAGYHKTGGRLTEVLVRGAGHMAPQDAPGAVRRLVGRWTHARPLDTAPAFDDQRIRQFVWNTTNDIHL